MHPPRDPNAAVNALRLATLCEELRRHAAYMAQCAQQISELADALVQRP